MCGAVCVMIILFTNADIDECVLGEHQCDNDTSTCVNTNGNYTCNCNIGFTGGDRECEGTKCFSTYIT